MLWGVDFIFDKEGKPPFPPRNRKNVSQINFHLFTSLYTRTLKEILGHMGEP